MANCLRGIWRLVVAIAGVGLGLAAPVGNAGASTILVNDGFGAIFEVDTLTGATALVGYSGVFLTDIAMDPTGNLWGVSYTHLYSIDPSTGAATLVGDMGTTDANALVFDDAGNGYLAGFESEMLRLLDTGDASTTLIGGTSNALSAGDLEFGPGGELYLATVDHTLRIYDPLTSTSEIGAFGVVEMFGLAFEDGVMWGVAGTGVYSIDLATGAATLVSSYSGFAGALGATAITIVPEPETALLMGIGLFGLASCASRFDRRRTA